MKQFIFITCCFIGLNFSLLAQTPNFAWAKSSTGLGSENGAASVSDSNGNIYVVGSFNKDAVFGSFTLNNPNNVDNIFLVKYDPNGNVIWAKNAGGTDYDRGSLCIDSNDNLYLAGYFTSPTITFGNTTLTNTAIGTTDIFIAKYDINGNVIWAKKFGSTVDDAVNVVSADPWGNIFILGEYNSPSLTFGSNTIYNTFSNGVCPDILLAKLDSNGNALWAKSAGGNGNSFDQGQAIQTDLNGNVYIAGIFNGSSISFGAVNLTCPYIKYEIYLVKYDSMGNALWGRNTNGTSNGNLWSVTVDYLGNPIIAGSFGDSTVTFNNMILSNPTYMQGLTNGDIFIVKYDNNGNIIWGKSAGSPRTDEVLTVTTDDVGNVYVGGYGMGGIMDFGSFTQNIGDNGNVAMFAVKYDINGNALGAIGNNASVISDITIDPFNKVYLLGNYNDTVTFGAISLVNSGANGSDNFLAKMDNTLNIDEIDGFSSFTIFPNPFSSTLKLTFDNYQENSSIFINDLTGKEIKSIAVTGKELQFSTIGMSSGMYILKLQNAKGHITGVQKIICQ